MECVDLWPLDLLYILHNNEGAAMVMKGSRYYWGRLFIGTAKLISRLCIVGTVLACLVTWQSMKSDVNDVRFVPDPAIARAVKNVEAVYKSTQDFLASILGDDAVSHTHSPVFPKTFSTERDFKVAYDCISSMRENIIREQDIVLSGFNTSIDIIIGSMQRGAAKSRSSLIKDNEDDSDRAKIEQKIRQLEEKLDPRSSVYGNISEGDYFLRIRTLRQCNEYLDDIGSYNPPESIRKAMDQCRLHAERLRDMFPEPVSDEMRSRVGTAIETERERLSLLTSGGSPLKGEKMASDLSRVKAEVDQAFRSSWRIDSALESLHEVLDEGSGTLTMCRQAERKIRAVHFWRIGRYLLQGLGLSFFLLVLSDFLCAHFDMAEGTIGQ